MHDRASMLGTLLGHGSLAIVFLVLVAGGLGVPIPEDIVLLTAGGLAHRRVVSWEAALAVCAAGVFIGDLMIFAMAKRLGPAAVERPLFRRMLTPDRFARVTALFAKYGGKVVFVARFVVGLRAPTFALAGMNGMPTARFLFWDGLALCVSAPLYFGLGYVFSRHLDDLEKGVVRFEHVIVGSLVVAVVGYQLFTVIRRRRPREPPNGDMTKP